MATELESLKKFFNKAEVLLTTDLTFKSIYEFTILKNKSNKAFEYVTEKGSIKSLCYCKVNKLVEKYAAIIQETFKNCTKHTPILLKYINSPDWCALFWAILMAGFKPLLVNTSVTRDGVNNLIKESKASGIITDDPFKYDVGKIQIDDLGTIKTSTKLVADWENEVIFCSSGTVGDVKMMIFNGENMCHQIAASLEMPEKTKDIMYPGKVKILGMIPFYHIFGFVAVFLWYTFYGKTIVFPMTTNSKEVLEICQKRGVTHVYSVPLFWDSIALQFNRKKELAEPEIKTMLTDLVNANLEGEKVSAIVQKKVQSGILGSKVRFCISGGGYLSEETSKTINGIGYPLYNGFGMTEIGVTSVELSPQVSHRILCSIGEPFHGIEYKIKGEGQGELLIKSKQVHVKEIVGGEVVDARLDEEGYFQTGDIVERNDTGAYFVKGRMKDVIINADGENIFPDELELYYKNIKNVSNICVLGVPTEKNKHKENVVIVVELEHPLTTEQLKLIENTITQIGSKLPKRARVDKVLFYAHKLPMANNMKVKRAALKEAILNQPDEFITLDASEAKEEIKFDNEVVEKILNPIKCLFAEVLSLPLSKVQNDSHWIANLGGDSMNYIEVVEKINERFQVTIPEDKYGLLTCVNDFVIEVDNILKAQEQAE